MDEAAHHLRRDVEALCSDACAGRAPGSDEGAAARALIVQGLREAGLAPSLHPVPRSGGVNVIARAGEGPARVLVGAHYDHLGGRFLGADDNAAAVALLLQLGRELAAVPAAGGSVVLCAFDAEEPPHFMTPGMGSFAYVREPAFPLAELRLCIILDLVGHAVGPEGTPASVRQSLFALGAETSPGTAELVAAAAQGVDGVVLRPLGIDVIPPLSDYEAFRRARVPFVFLTCGRWRHYHTTDDTPDRLDYDKLDAITRFTGRLARAAAAAPPSRLDDGASHHATTLATTRALAAELAPVSPRAASVVSALGAMHGRLDARGRLSVSDYSTLLQLVGLLEQGLA